MVVKKNSRSCVDDRHQMLDEILLGRSRADLAAAAAPLGAVERQRGALDITAMGDGDQHILFDDQILNRKVAFALDNLGAARIGELLLDVLDLVRR